MSTTRESKVVDSLICTYAVSVVAASIAEIATYPLDLTKTRLQIQGEKAAAHALGSTNVSITSSTGKGSPYRGMFQTAVGIAREEGPLKLWQGITPALYRHLVYSGTRIVVYDALRNDIIGRNPDGTFPLWKSAISGVIAGAIAQYLASPADLIKVQIQMEGKRKLLGKPARVLGFSHAFRKIVSEGGVRGLWKGSIPNVQRAALVNLGDLTTYDTAKSFILKHTSLKDGYFVHMLSSGCAGLIAAIMGTPADVVKTRIMNQPTDSNGKGLVYKSSVDCLMKTIGNEGFWALYKGFLPVWIRMGPWSLIFWVSFEHIRSSMGSHGF